MITKTFNIIIPTFLKKVPHTLSIAENGIQALETFKSAKYDIVLMDMQMPVMDGYTATLKIREWEKATETQPTPIIALTAHDSHEDLKKIIDAGCDRHLANPVSKKNLISMIYQFNGPRS